MTDSTGQGAEPTNAEIMAALNALATDIAVIKTSQTQAHFAASQNSADISVLRESHAKTHAAVKAASTTSGSTSSGCERTRRRTSSRCARMWPG